MDDTEIFSQLNYSEYPGLSTVRLAAQNGDYDTAKKELLSYYRQRKAAGTVRALKITEADRNQGIAELALDNILTGPYELDMPIGRLIVEGIGERAARYYTADVTEKAAAELDNGSFSVMLFGRQKQAYPVIVKAKESGDAPMLKVTTTDGAEHIIYANNDTYISAGEADKPHGSESVMYVHEESGNPEEAVGERTRRAYINFPLSPISGKRIARAELAVKAYVDGGCDTGSKDVFIISIGDTAWSEDTLSWSGVGGSIYSWHDNKSGPPWNSPENSDSEYLNVTARFRFGTPMAYEYLKCIADPEGYPEGEQYGKKLLFLMRAFAEKKEYGFNRTLETGERLSRWVDIIDALMDTPAMTPDIFCNLISFVRGDCEFINSLDIENDAYWWSNWRIVANAGFFKGTEYLPEFNTYREFREKAEENIKYCMALLYNADMSFREAGPAYALWCAELFCDCIEMAEMNGHPISAELKEKLKYAARFAMESFCPNGYDTNIGDSNYINKLGSFKRLADFLNDDALAAYASGGREGIPGYLSSFYADANSAFMRNSWNPDNAVYVSFLNNPYDGHAHPDSNQVLMYAYGKPLLIDSGRYSYSSYNDIYNRLRTAAAHNTIEVVGEPLAPHSAAAKPFIYHISNKAFEFNTSVQTGYEAIAHTRNVLFMYDGYAIVTDYIESSENHQYRQNWHFMPSANAKADGGRVQTAFNNQANITIVSAGVKAEILDGFHSANYGLAARSSYASYLKTGKTVKLDTVLYPQRAGEEPPELEAIELENGVEKSAVRLSGALNGLYYVNHTDSSDGCITDGRDSYKTDAKLFYAEGGRIILAHGKSVIKNGKILIESPRAIPDISIVIKDGVMNIYGDSITVAVSPKNAVKIKADGIRKAYINGKESKIIVTNGYIVSVEVNIS